MSNGGITKISQYLTFKLGDEIFAINVTQVREVLELTSITKVPRAYDFMRGVINVRGSVVPVVDLRLKFGMTRTEQTKDSRIIVIDLKIDDDQITLGAMADSVHEVMDLLPDQIEEPPKIGSRWKTEFINGIGKRNDEFIIILDIDRIFSTDEIGIIQDTEGLEEDRKKEKSAAK